MRVRIVNLFHHLLFNKSSLSLFSANGRHIHHREFRLGISPLLIQSEFKSQPLAAAAMVHTEVKSEKKCNLPMLHYLFQMSKSMFFEIFPNGADRKDLHSADTEWRKNLKDINFSLWIWIIKFLLCYFSISSSLCGVVSETWRFLIFEKKKIRGVQNNYGLNEEGR